MQTVKVKLYRIYSTEIHWLLGLKVMIENQKGYLILDTGAQNSVLNSCLFTHSKLKTIARTFLNVEKGEVVGIAPNTFLDFQLISKISVVISKNKFQVKNVIFTNLSHIQSKFKKKYIILGILGNDFLHQQKAIINYENKTLMLFKSS